MSQSENPRLYVLVRSDLDATYRMVQGMHAVAAHTLQYPNEWKNETIVVCKVKHEAALENWLFKLQNHDRKFTYFHEPDIDNQLTALATVDKGSFF